MILAGGVNQEFVTNTSIVLSDHRKRVKILFSRQEVFNGEILEVTRLGGITAKFVSATTQTVHRRNSSKGNEYSGHS